MNHKPLPQEDDDAFDQLLSQHLNAPGEQLQPSSGFTLTVMDGIHQYATVPPPIPFPWKRALAGISAALCALVAFLIYVVSIHPWHQAFAPDFAPSSISLAPATQIELLCVVIAIVLSVTTVIACLRLAGHSR